MTDTYRLNITLPGGAAFDGEGPQDAIREDYRQFIEVIQAVSNNAPKPDDPPPDNDFGPDDRSGSAGLAEDVITRLFKTDKTQTVSLRALPKTKTSEADALLALIYGHQTLRSEHDISGDSFDEGGSPVRYPGTTP